MHVIVAKYKFRMEVTEDEAPKISTRNEKAELSLSHYPIERIHFDAKILGTNNKRSVHFL
jgi:hypothetical protein